MVDNMVTTAYIKGMSFTQIKIKSEVKEKLRILADAEGRTMANMVERLIDTASSQKPVKQPLTKKAK